MTHHENIQTFFLSFLAGEKAGKDCCAGSAASLVLLALLVVALL